MRLNFASADRCLLLFVHYTRLFTFHSFSTRSFEGEFETLAHKYFVFRDIRRDLINPPHFKSTLATMSDFNYGGTDEESAEIKKLNAEVVSILKAS
jgi:hypothetical protein